MAHERPREGGRPAAQQAAELHAVVRDPRQALPQMHRDDTVRPELVEERLRIVKRIKTIKRICKKGSNMKRGSTYYSTIGDAQLCAVLWEICARLWQGCREILQDDRYPSATRSSPGFAGLLPAPAGCRGLALQHAQQDETSATQLPIKQSVHARLCCLLSQEQRLCLKQRRRQALPCTHPAQGILISHSNQHRLHQCRLTGQQGGFPPPQRCLR